MILIDPKQTELRRFKDSAKTLAYINENIKETFDQFTLKMIQGRFANLKVGKSNFHEPKLYLIFDEVRDAFTHDSLAPYKALGKVMRYHQELGIELVMSTQREELPPSLTKYADTIIHFSKIVKPIHQEKDKSPLQNYLHFESLGLEGNQQSINTFLKDYREVIPSDAKVFQVNHTDNNSFIQLEGFIKDCSNISPKISMHPLAFAFIQAKGKITENLEFYFRLKDFVKKASTSRVSMILVMEEPYKIPQMLRRELHTSITFIIKPIP